MKKTTGALVLAFSCFIFGEGIVRSQEVKPIMNSFYQRIEELAKFMGSDEKFSDPKNESIIKKNLSEISDLASKVGHQKQIKAPGFRISQQVLVEHFKETEKVFKSGNKSYARWMLNSSLGVCMSCHTQLPSESRPNFIFNEDKVFASLFDQAEFHFATRNFDRSVELFKKLVSGFPQNKASATQLETSFERVLTYYVRVKRDPIGGMAAMKELIENPKVPQYLKKNANAWNALLKEWSKEKPFDLKKADDKSLKAYVEKILKPDLWDKMITSDNPRVVSYLKVSGLLYEYLLTSEKTKMVPQILLWLAQCDRALSKEFFFSLSDMYLKECMVSYSADPLAKKCFTEYEDNILFSYSGSGGTNIPEEVYQELSKYRKMVGLKAD